MCAAREWVLRPTNDGPDVSRHRSRAPKIAEPRRGVAGADLTGIPEATLTVLVITNQQRTEIRSAASWIGVAADD